MARLSSDHLSELRAIHTQLTAALTWLHRHGQLGQGDWQAPLDDALARQDLRGMRMAGRDIREMLFGLPPSVRAQLLKAGERVTGMFLADEVRKDAEAAAKIIERDRIRDDKEYYLLRSRLEYVQDEPAAAEETGALLRLLNQYRA